MSNEDVMESLYRVCAGTDFVPVVRTPVSSAVAAELVIAKRGKTSKAPKGKDKKWMQHLKIKKGALRKYLESKYGLKVGEKITADLLDKAEKGTKDETILKRINLARQFIKVNAATASWEGF